jgi:hypothetical protein
MPAGQIQFPYSERMNFPTEAQRDERSANRRSLDIDREGRFRLQAKSRYDSLRLHIAVSPGVTGMMASWRAAP